MVTATAERSLAVKFALSSANCVTCDKRGKRKVKEEYDGYI